MQNHSLPPAALMLRQCAFVMRASRALYAVARLDVAEILSSGPASSREIAAKVGADAATVRRLLRAVVAQGVFEEETPDCFRLNPAGELLRGGVPGSQRAGVLFTAGDLQWHLWSDWMETVRTGRATVERVRGMHVFERLAEAPEEAALFDQAMESFSAALSAPLLASYDFGAFGCIADIGGGTGRLLADILAANPGVRGVLFDVPSTATRAAQLLEASGVTQRCNLVSGDFLKSVPQGADAYLLKHILHDWDDSRATEILANCRRAMADQATLLIVERVMPEKAETGRAVEAYLVDLEMLLNTPGGRERSAAEYRALLSGAGFELTRVVPTTAPVSVIEARPSRTELSPSAPRAR